MSTALQGIAEHKEALLAQESASNPTFISYHAHRLAQFLVVADDHLSDLVAELERKESESFNKHVQDGMSPNASKEMVRREFIEERTQVLKIGKLVSGGWKLVNESQSRVKHLIAEATNQI